jgi:hypothetical protein
MFNSMAYPIFIMFLADTTIISKPVIKLQLSGNIGKTVTDNSKEVLKHSFLWGLLLCLPFIIYIFCDKNLFNRFDYISVAVIASGLVMIAHLLVLSTIILTYHRKLYWALICGLGVIFTSFLAYIPHTELNLLYLSIAIVILVYLSGLLLTRKIKAESN